MASNGKATLHVRRMIQNSVRYNHRPRPQISNDNQVPIFAPKLFARLFHFISSQVDIDNTKVTAWAPSRLSFL